MRFDIAIVGAGPAGSWAACCLARCGAKVALFDPSHPREKPCGGGVTARALDLVSRELEGKLRFVAASAALFEGRDGMAARVPLSVNGLSAGSSLVIVSRRDFDGVLVDCAREAGADLIAERVIDVEASAHGVALRTGRAVYRAAFLLGADGANSLVRRRIVQPFTRGQLSIATGVFIQGVSDEDIVIRCVENPPGYIWSFPRPDHLAVGICAQADVTGSADLRERTKSWLATTCSLDRHAVAAARHDGYSWPIPSLAPQDFPRQRIGGPRWMLLGDAAGLVDPLTREGIFFALRSAELAARVLSTSNRKPESVGEDYRKEIARSLYPELQRAAYLKRSFFTGSCADLMVHALARSAAVRQVMVGVIEGRQPYIGLRRRLMKTGEFGLALRLAWHEIGSRVLGSRVLGSRELERR